MSDFYLCEHAKQCCGSCIRAIKTEVNRVEAERDGLLCTLASERDAWEKKKTDLMVEKNQLEKEYVDLTVQVKELQSQLADRDAMVERLTKVLEYIELTGGNCGHDGMGPDIPCPCGACMAEAATKGFTAERSSGNGP